MEMEVAEEKIVNQIVTTTISIAVSNRTEESTPLPTTTTEFAVTTTEVAVTTTDAVINTTTVEVLPTTESHGDDDSMPIIVGAIGSAIFLCVLLLTIYCLCRNRRRKREKKTPPELPNPFAPTTKEDSTESGVRYTPSAESDSTSGAVQVLGIKPLPRSALLPPRKASSATTDSIPNGDVEKGSKRGVSELSSTKLELQGVYNNEDVVQASALSKSPELMRRESAGEGESRDSLYARPNSLHSPDVSSHGEDNIYIQADDAIEDGSISRSRLDSQKYLLPAELVLQQPKDMRKMSSDSVGEGVTSGTPRGSNVNIKWKAQAPIIHVADSDRSSTGNSVYICMDGGSQPNSPIPSAAASKEGNPPPISTRPLPKPCSRVLKDKTSYINLRQASEISAQPSSPVADVYEPVSSLVSQDVYGNAEEIARNQLSPSEDAGKSSEIDTYAIYVSPEPLATRNSNADNDNMPSEQDFNDMDYVQSTVETPSSGTTSNFHHLNDLSETNSTDLSYVNVDKFQKRPSKNEESLTTIQADSYQPQNLSTEQVSEAKVNPAPEEKLGTRQGSDRPKPPIKKKKPTKLSTQKKKSNQEPNGNTLAKYSTGAKHGEKPSLIQRAKGHFRSNSGSSSDHSSDDAATVPDNSSPDNAKDAVKKPNSKQALSQAVSAAYNKTGNSEAHTTGELSPSNSVQTTKDTDGGDANEACVGEGTQNVDSKEKNTHAKSKKEKVHHRKSGSLFRGKLDLSEIRSKLKKTY